MTTNPRNSKGQSFLATVLLIGLVIIAIGVTLLFLVNSSIDVSYGYQASVQAEATATSGAEDALLQLNRDPAFYDTGGYNVTVGSNTATVTVTQDAGGESDTIVSTASVASRVSTITVKVSIDPTTKQISVVSWQATPSS